MENQSRLEQMLVRSSYFLSSLEENKRSDLHCQYCGLQPKATVPHTANGTRKTCKRAYLSIVTNHTPSAFRNGSFVSPTAINNVTIQLAHLTHKSLVLQKSNQVPGYKDMCTYELCRQPSGLRL